ncbi:trophinin-like [Ochotona curzoniae]|uniref:trophinin-like n=1 Tax=Ochotona curzoniae TaxID=130825 RepID=UPI001B3491F6|nr:trophinin-like [Ochotona curzoniae]
MPRGQKSKQRAREKRRQAQTQGEESKDGEHAQATVVEKEESLSFSASNTKCSIQGPPAAGAPGTEQKPERATGAVAADSHTSSQVGRKPNAQGAAKHLQGGPLAEKVAMLVHYLLIKYQLKESVTKSDMLKNVVQTYKNHFPEILKKASERLELVFGLDLKEVDHNRSIYVLVNKLEANCNTTVNESSGVPKTGLLMIILGVIFTKGNCAAEEQVWDVLSMMGIYKDSIHFIFGDPKKVVTEDLVQAKYLEYRQVANSDPPRYELLWGPRSYAETTKMRVLEFLAKIHDTVPSSFPTWYEEALRDEEERAQARVAARARISAIASARSKALSSSLCPKKLIMPRGQKSKLRAREKRRQLQTDPENLVGAQAPISKESESSPSSSHSKDGPQDSLTEPRSNLQDSKPVTSTTTAEAVPAKGSDEGTRKPGSTQSQSATNRFPNGPLDERIIMLVHYLLYKYQMKQPIWKAEMLKNIIQTYRSQFNEILRKASEHLELIFGLDLKEVDPNKHIYVLVDKLESNCDGRLSDDIGVPKTGLLMTILGVIFTNSNCAAEEKVWQVLNMMGLYEKSEHFVFGNVRKLITQDFVADKYLEYRQVPDSDPPRYEFLWGSRAHAETSKMKVLEFLSKIHDTVPSAFPDWYEEALKDEEERAQARAAAKARISAMASARSAAMSKGASHSQ